MIIPNPDTDIDPHVMIGHVYEFDEVFECAKHYEDVNVNAHESIIKKIDEHLKSCPQFINHACDCGTDIYEYECENESGHLRKVHICVDMFVDL